MSTATNRPASDSSIQLSTFGSGTGSYGRINEVTEDATNGVKNTTGPYPYFDSYGFGLSDLGTLNSVTVHVKCQTDAFASGYDPTVRLVNRKGANTYFGGYNNITTSDAEYSYGFTTNLAWTNTFGVELTGSFAPDFKSSAVAYCYQLWIVVDYTAAGWTHIAKWNGVATSTIKTINGVAVANIKSKNGVAV
jgi:hypothetical protein